MKAYWGNRDIVPLIPNVETSYKYCLTSQTGCCSFWNEPHTHCKGGCVGFGEDKKTLAPKFNVILIKRSLSESPKGRSPKILHHLLSSVLFIFVFLHAHYNIPSSYT